MTMLDVATQAPIDLMPFCGPSGTRYSMSEPWVRKGWVYATNGRVAIRCPVDDIVPDSPANTVAEPAAQLFDECLDVSKCANPWPDPACLQCGGFGVVNRARDGKEVPCLHCDGKKRYAGEVLYKAYLMVGVHRISAEWEGLICNLPNVRWQSSVAAHRPLPFVFDGGQGLVMPMQQDD